MEALKSLRAAGPLLGIHGMVPQRSAAAMASSLECFGSTPRVRNSGNVLRHAVTRQVCCASAANEDETTGFTLQNVAKSLQKCVLSAALAAFVSIPQISAPDAVAVELTRGPVLSELAGLIAGPPVKDPEALLRYALPIKNKSIKEVQKSLEEITDILKLPGVKAIEPVERAVRQTSRLLNQNRDAILADVAEGKKKEATQLLSKLSDGLQDFQKILEAKERGFIAPKQKQLLSYVGEGGTVENSDWHACPHTPQNYIPRSRLTKIENYIYLPEIVTAIVKDNPHDFDASYHGTTGFFDGKVIESVEETMVGEFPFEVPAEYASRPLLKGRASVEMKVNVKDNPNFSDIIFEMTVDGYNAPVTAGNFIDLVVRRFYDGMEIQRADGFVVQTGDPDGPAEGFVDPSTGKLRTIPLEIMVEADTQPIYNATLEELGRFQEQTKLPFNAFGTLAMAREEFEPESASSQIFWLLKESELTPSNANILDGTYAVFGYVTANEELFADLKVGDVIESIKVTNGLDNLVNPSYAVGGA